MAGGDLLGIGSSGIISSQRALGTAGHNIANATTPGYTRQRVDLEARTPQIFGNGAVGTGVIVSDVNRVYNEYLVAEVRETTSLNHFLQKSYEYTSQVDNMLADPQAGLAPAMANFFDAVNGVANNPSSTAAREVLLGASRNLSDRFAYMNNRFEALREAANKDIRTQVEEINQLAKAIANVNTAIVRAQEISTRSANDLLDQRDRLVQELSEKINVRITIQDDSRMNVFVGNGQTLVVGDIASTLDVKPNEHDSSRLEVLFVGNQSELVITQFLTGGALGGINKFRNEMLDPAQNELGRIAIGIASGFNAQHHLGMDMNNKLGEDFFHDLNRQAPEVMPSVLNRGDLELSAEITDAGALTTSNYRLLYQKGQYELLRIEDNKVVARFSGFPQDIATDGFRLSIKSGSAVQEGDRFIIQPTRRAGDLFGIKIASVDKIAAASPIRAEADIDNLGSAKIQVTQIDDTNNTLFSAKSGELSPPYVLRFTDSEHFEILDNQGRVVKAKVAAVADDPEIPLTDLGKRGAIPATPAVPAKETGDRAIRATPAQPPEKHARRDNQQHSDDMTVVEGPIAYDRRKGLEIFPTPGGLQRGFRVRIDGEPKAGDIFRIEFNQDGIGDNHNALALAELQTKPILMEGRSDYAQTYGQLVSRVGSKTHELDINRVAQKILLDQAIESRESASGVNLDEEAADIVRFQNQYQANAQVVATANRLFEILMGTFRR